MIAVLESWANELDSRASRVRQLIGDKHWLSDGHQKEYILKEFLVRHLPPNLLISRGFIRPADPELAPSGEIDIVIADAKLHTPWFREGDLIITPPEAVLAQLHVKTGFGSTEIADVFYSLSAAATVCKSQKTLPWAGGFFFRNDTKLEKLEEIFERVLKAQIQNSDQTRLEYFRACLVVIDGPVVLVDGSDSTGLKVRAFEVGRLSAALFLCALTNHIRLQDNSTVEDGALTNLLGRCSYNLVFEFIINSK
jgi:hypothetical protein